MNFPTTVDEYIAKSPEKSRDKLISFRKIIRETAPLAAEKLSYGMPYYSYKGKLVYFAAFKDHVSLFAVPPIPDNLRKKVQKYMTGKSTIRFELDQKLPIALIKKIVTARVQRNENAHRE